MLGAIDPLAASYWSMQLTSFVSDDLWPYIYVIFLVSLVAIVLGYWLILRGDKRAKPLAEERLQELRAISDRLPAPARAELLELVPHYEDLYRRTYYTRCLKYADIMLNRSKELLSMVEQARAEIRMSEDRLREARAMGLEINEDNLGLTDLRRDLERYEGASLQGPRAM